MRSETIGGHSTACMFFAFRTQVFQLSQQTLRDFTSGQVMDLISNDVERMERAPKAFLRTLVTIVHIVLSILLLWRYIGWQALTGVAIYVACVPLSVGLAYISGKLRETTAGFTDRRLLLMKEILSTIRTVKTNAWEWIYRNKVAEIRR